MRKAPIIILMLIITMVTPLVADDVIAPVDPVWEMIYALQEENRQQREQIAVLQEQLASQGEGNIRLVSPQNITLEAGETREITLTVRNVGSHEVRNLFTLAAPSDNSPFTVEFLRNSNSVSTVNANAQRTMTLQITVDANADPGNYFIELSHFFRDEVGRTSSSADTINVRIGGITGEPNVRLGSFQTMHTGAISPGQTFTVSATIQNLGNATARDVRVSVPENMRAENNIFITSDLNQALFAAMEQGHSSTLNFTFQASNEIVTGAYTVTFHITFKDESGREFGPVIIPFTVNAVRPDEATDEISILEIRDMSVPVGRINVAQTGHISFTIHNSGEVTARNIRVEATPENEQAIVPTTTNIQIIPSLEPGESRQVTFNFSPTDRAVTRSYPIRFRTTYQTGRSGETHTFDQFAGFNVYNPEEEDDAEAGRSQIPRVIVAEYSIEPAVPRAGQEFTMTITFRNTNAARSVNNVRILMEEVSTNTAGQSQNHFAGFTPVGGSNTLFIENMRPHSEETMILHFTTSAEATSGAHNMRISFDYQDDTFETHTASEQISISVAQTTQLELEYVNVSEFASLGDSVWFSFNIINSGRVNLTNIRVRTEGPFDVTEAGRYVGPLNAQRSVGFDGRFTPLEAGQHQGQFIITGEDTTGAILELVYPFNIQVADGFGGDFIGGDYDGAWGGDRDGLWDGGGMMGFPDDGMGMGGTENGSGGSGFLRNFFIKETAPEGFEWIDEMGGDYAMYGVEPNTSIRWVNIAIVVGVVLAAIAVPVFIVVKKKKSRLDFDDEE